MADFKLRSPPRLRMAAGFQIDGAFGLTDVPVQLAGSAIARAQSTAVLLRGVNLGGAAAASAQATAALLRGLRLQGSAVAGATSVASLGWSVAPTITFLAGTGGTFNVAATGPAGYTSGGVYGVDPLNTALPSLITLSEAGVLADGGSAVTSANAIRFTYHEPGALPTLTLHPTVTATLPYHATVYLCEGVVPAGQILVSPDDANLRGSVLSSYADGSAQVMVVAGETAVTNAVTKTIRLRPGAPSGTALTASRIDAIVSDIVVNFGGGDQTLGDFTSPLRTWWANSATICCRYVLGCGLGTMRAIIDIHAFKAGVSDRAFVEIVIENGSFNANSGSQPAPAPQTYAGATVKVNGATIATVDSSGSPSGSHQGFRAWYCSSWVGLDPGIEITHDTASMQAHPLFLRVDKATDQNLQTLYQSDSYTPWSTGRQRAVNMGGGGDHPSIGYLTQWDTRYLQSGDKYARRAVLASALAVLTYNVNYRHSGTGASDNLVPTFDQSNGYQHSGGGGWPATSNGDVADWEVAHHPAEGLVAFLCRPSPCFIEIAQKIAHWNGTWSNGINGVTANGTFGYWYQVRGKAWGVRSLGHAIFLTPDGHPWKTPARDCLTRNVNGLLGYRDSVKNKLDTTWGGDPAAPWDDNAGGTFQNSTFMSFYFVQCMHHIANAKVLLGSEQANMAALADWSAKLPVRYCNESPGGAFRSMPQRWTIGATGGANFTTVAMDQYNDWNEMVTTTISGTLPAVSGPWRSEGNNGDSWSNFIDDNTAGAYYPSYYWAALCCAVERDIPGASSAWAKVTGGSITNLASWRDGFAAEPRWGYYPRNQ